MLQEMLNGNDGYFPECLGDSNVPVHYVTKEMQIVCADCANENKDDIIWCEPNITKKFTCSKCGAPIKSLARK